MVTLDAEITAQLIDFGWAGKKGEVLYPFFSFSHGQLGLAGMWKTTEAHLMKNGAGVRRNVVKVKELMERMCDSHHARRPVPEIFSS